MTSSMQSSPGSLSDVYEGVSTTIRVLRALGWGPQLLNLGYFNFRGPLNALNFLPTRFRLAAAQHRLVRRASELLAPAAGDKVLDVACGRGQSSYYLAGAYPGIEVTAIDVLPENIGIATTLYKYSRGLQYQIGDACRLEFADASFDRILCLEAAFHFPDRMRFLREAARVLKPGGNLVLLDFAWRRRQPELLKDPRTQYVQRTWGWGDFSSIEEYRVAAGNTGFQINNEYDWSSRVTRPLQGQFEALMICGRSAMGRRALSYFHPMLRSLTRRDWQDMQTSVEAHRFVHQHAAYLVLNLQKIRTTNQKGELA